MNVRKRDCAALPIPDSIAGGWWIRPKFKPYAAKLSPAQGPPRLGWKII